ncbi:MAG: PSD1 and planctomycete cytochrome C domain-containing protein [Armatimonadota bacterium]
MSNRSGEGAPGRTPAKAWLASVSTMLVLAGAVAKVPASEVQRPGPPADPAGIEFFERKVRPILEENCTGCHGAARTEANLRLDRPSLLRRGGPRGPAVVPGDAAKSTLVRAIRYEDHTLMMPPSGKLAPEQIATLEDWVRRGAPAPSDTAAKPVPPAGGGFQAEIVRRRSHWAYAPVVRSPVPAVKAKSRVRNPIDAFLLARLEKAGLSFSPDADARTLIRRATIDLIGVPPTAPEVEAYVADRRPDKYERLVDRLLASPQYGERWARHWLDLVRYGESMGHEFDFDIPNAWRYRDWVVSAFNDDLPYDRFVTEQLAGDLVPTVRRDPKTGWNLSRVGTGFYWLGEGKHSPVDVRQEQADRLDNQIDVIGKAFLGQTVACARCHDHKFDPIPASDYYALYGILKSSRFEHGIANDLDFAKLARDADAIRASVDRGALAAAWKQSLASLPEAPLLSAASTARLPGGQGLGSMADWKASGEALAADGRAGDVVLTSDPAKPVRGVLPVPAVHGGLRSLRLEGARRSRNFVLDKPYVWVRVAGRSSRVNLIVENFIVIRGPIFDVCDVYLDHDDTRWRRIDVGIWKGRTAFLEVSDSPTPTLSLGGPGERPVDGWAAIDGWVVSDSPNPPADRGAPLAGMDAEGVRRAVGVALDRWQSGMPPATSEDTAALMVLDKLLREGRLDSAPAADAARGRAALEETVPAPVRFMAMVDGPGQDERVFIRGNHRALGTPAPRFNLAICFREKSPAPLESGSGRLELARWIASPKHPLTSRVLVNRFWHHHFGAGLVKSTDDLGHMGEKPSHPELVDWLASEFVRQGWSMKRLHRLITTSTAYRQSSTTVSSKAETVDPTNKLWWKRSVRRMEAEAIRDSVLAVAGALDPRLGGPSIPTYLEENVDGRGRPGQGPLDGAGRRSIYLSVRRNFPSAFLQAFDSPTPFTAIGRRTVSNVPAQALVMMNGAFVREMARRWATRELALPDAGRIDRMALAAFGRPASGAERAAAAKFTSEAATPEAKLEAWSELAHVLLNVKEFVFVR